MSDESEIGFEKKMNALENDQTQLVPQKESVEFQNNGEAKKNSSTNAVSDPAMDRIQSALKAQLIQTRDRLERELREERNGLRNAKKEREDCGVELYGMQKQLAKLQNALDGSVERHKQIVENRSKSDDTLAELRSKLNQTCSEKEKLEKDISAFKVEEREIENMLRNALKFNNETKKEVEITKRIASKAEEMVKNSEKGKEAQDFYINGLTQQLREMEADLRLLNESIDIQKIQNKESDALLQDLSNELNELSREKKHLFHQWNSSVLALGRRDQALVAVSKASEKVTIAVNDNETELTVLKKEARVLTQKKENIEFDKNKIQNELAFLDENINKFRWEQEALASQIEIISKIVTKTKEEQTHEERAAKRLKSNTEALSRKIEMVSNQRREVENEIATYKEGQATISQAAMAVVKQEKELARRLHDKEIEAGYLENELSRVKIEIMNKTINCSRLKDQFQDEANNLTSVNRSIANTELEIRRTNDDIDRKMGTVNILNKKYEQMMEGAEEEEPLGPLEGTIRKLEKEIQMMDQETIKLQSAWASQQSDLIKVLDANERLESENRVKGAKLTILQQKRLRLLQDINTNEAATKAISVSINSMHTDISRLNDLIGRYTKMMESLGSDNAIKQIAFDDESRTLEDTAKSIEMKIATVVSEKEDLLKQIIQSEREILEWEKKIQLEKDTQKLLNSSEHAIEIKGMEKEIHRMKHRLDDMNRQQEKMIRDMEFAIRKREDIAVKYQKRSGSNSNYNPVSIGEMKRTKADLHEKQMLIDQENSSLTKRNSELQLKSRKIEEEIKAIQLNLEKDKSQNKKLYINLNKLIFDKQRVLIKVARLQEVLQKYKILSEQAVPIHEGGNEIEVLEARLSAVNRKIGRAVHVITGLKMKYKQYEDILERVRVIAGDDICNTSRSIELSPSN